MIWGSFVFCKYENKLRLSCAKLRLKCASLLRFTSKKVLFLLPSFLLMLMRGRKGMVKHAHCKDGERGPPSAWAKMFLLKSAWTISTRYFHYNWRYFEYRKISVNMFTHFCPTWGDQNTFVTDSMFRFILLLSSKNNVKNILFSSLLLAFFHFCVLK